MPEGTIDGEPYPIALGDRGQTLWETTAARDLPDEIWDDWSLGLGETKQETGRGYILVMGRQRQGCVTTLPLLPQPQQHRPHHGLRVFHGDYGDFWLHVDSGRLLNR
ncbi:hypothetical protein LCGC14_2009140 [marine sediment metagenome]|uniref:Uncharacterized protein n=1 Tax=marine sediment metagenome TaxID=412755 RepID=A0A0F9FNC0_9ZZZZ